MPGTLILSALSDGTSSTSASNVVNGSAKAWVNFDGTGTPAIRASFNVSSITDNGTGNYSVNFTNAMIDNNYAIGGMSRMISSGSATDGNWNLNMIGGQQAQWPYTSVKTTTAVRVITSVGSGQLGDSDAIDVQVFR